MNETPRTDSHDYRVSDTPRTDLRIRQSCGLSVTSYFAKQLERELTEWKQRYDEMRATAEALNAENERLQKQIVELQRDKELLDWLDSGAWKAERFHDTVWFMRDEGKRTHGTLPTVRGAIHLVILRLKESE